MVMDMFIYTLLNQYVYIVAIMLDLLVPYHAPEKNNNNVHIVALGVRYVNILTLVPSH